MKPTWIHEPEAARMLGYTSRDWFRRLVKSNKIRVAYTSTFGRNYQYNQRDLEKHLLNNSTK